MVLAWISDVKERGVCGDDELMLPGAKDLIDLSRSRISH